MIHDRLAASWAQNHIEKRVGDLHPRKRVAFALQAADRALWVAFREDRAFSDPDEPLRVLSGRLWAWIEGRVSMEEIEQAEVALKRIIVEGQDRDTVALRAMQALYCSYDSALGGADPSLALDAVFEAYNAWLHREISAAFGETPMDDSDVFTLEAKAPRLATEIQLLLRSLECLERLELLTQDSFLACVDGRSAANRNP